MGKCAIVYWSGTGNTKAMADLVQQGTGGTADMFTASEFSADKVAQYDAIAFGCPSMGAEELEESEFAPMFDSVESALSGKKIALFGSFGWGDGEWMRNWQARCESAGAKLLEDGLTCCGAPAGKQAEDCVDLGSTLSKA